VGSTRASIRKKQVSRKAMDSRVKPGNDANSFGTAPPMPLT
jgi:hypothetical protein